VQEPVKTPTAAFGDRFPAASAASTSRRYVVPHLKPMTGALSADERPTTTPSR
jgi:hypothetical protein